MASLALAIVVQSIVTGQTGNRELRLLSGPGVKPQVRGAVYRQQSGSLQAGVLVLHGSAGLRDEYYVTASELSRSGFVVLLVDLFAETGSVDAGSSKRLEAWSTWQATVRNALDCLRKLAGVDPGRIGIVGYSRGGWLAFTTAGNAPDVRAIATFYPVGSQPIDWQPAGPAILVLSGQLDRYADPALVARLDAGLRAAGRSVEVKVYDGVDHGFNFLTSLNPSVRLATRDAEERLRAFLTRRLN